MKIMKRIFKWMGIALAGVVVLVLLLVAAVLNTGTGARLAIEQVLPRLPIDVTVGDFQGRLARKFTITGIEIQDAAFDFRVDTLQVEWRPSGLVRREVNVDRLIVAGVEAAIHETDPEPEGEPADTAAGPLEIDLPVKISVGEARVRRVQATVPGGIHVGEADVFLAGSPDAYRIETRAVVNGPDIPKVRVSVAANGNLESAEVDRLRAELLDGVVTVAGHAAWLPAVEWDVSLAVDSIAPAPLLPDSAQFAGTVTMRASTKGRIGDDGPSAFVRVDTLLGSLGGYDLTGYGSVDVRSTNATLAPFSLAWGAMRVTIDGEAAWAPSVTWNVNVRADSVAPSLFMPDPTLLPGAITMHASTEGELRERADADPLVIAALQVDSLGGQLRGQPIRGGGRVSVHGERVEADSFEVFWGDTGIEVAGVYDTEIEAVLRLAIPDVSDVYPDASGSVYIDADVRGPQKEPAVKATVSVDSLAVLEYRVGHLAVDADVDILGSGMMAADIRGTGIEAAGQTVDSLLVRANGDAAAHEIAIVAGAPMGALALELAGSLADSVWSGGLERLEIRAGALGEWTLTASTPIEASPSHAVLSGFRMESNGAAIVAEGRWTKNDTLHALLRVDSLAYAFADTLLPEGLNVHGWLDVSLNADVSPAGDVRGRLAVESSPGAIAWQEGEETRRLEFDSTYVHGVIDSSGASAELNMRVHSGDKVLTYVSGGFELPGIGNINEIPDDPEFTARIKALFSDLSFINALSRDIKNAAGRFQIDAGFEGVVSDPEFMGTMKVSDAKLDVLPLGLKIRNIGVTAEGKKGSGVSLSGSMHSGGGTLELSTKVNREESRITIAGENFEISNTAEARIRVSPQIDMTMRGRRVDLSGEVRVPFTRIEVFQVPQSAVGVSKDVVFVGVDSTETNPPLDVFADLRVTLARDSVTFRGFGLYAELEGSMSVKERPGKPTTAAGELVITKGTYDAYGQLLQINPGRIGYAGGPIDNPGFDITAYRDITQYNVRAGLRVQGTARRPQITVFSDPAMSQNEALSYLLTGQPMTDGNQRDMAAAAALSMGMAQGNAYMQSIGRDVGLDEVRFESGGTLEEASFVAGKYLSPQLYISNTMGLFDRVSTWRVRYSMSRRWTLQAESGQATGSDLFYQYERGD